MSTQTTTTRHYDTITDCGAALTARVAELEALAKSAQGLRPILLRQYGAVPEAVLDFCNRARALLAKGA